MKNLNIILLFICLFFNLAAVNKVYATNHFDKNSPKSAENTLNSESKKVNLSIYPPAKDQLRWVIYLPTKQGESDYQVEIVGGKNMLVDCNHQFMSGHFSEKDVIGWGYNYFQFDSTGLVASTKMGCPSSVLEERFISAPSMKTRYNSKLPIIIYTPKEFQIRYRTWKVDGDFKFAEQK